MNSFGLTELQTWYIAQCDGAWEHTYGIKIETLDNPGWMLRVDLAETELAGRAFDRVEVERSEQESIHAWVEREVFDSVGGPANLFELIAIFGAFANSAPRGW
jgi:hypothetical protein